MDPYPTGEGLEVDGGEEEDDDAPPPSRFMQLIDVKNRVYRCTICDMTFVTGKNVLRHEESHVRGMMMVRKWGGCGCGGVGMGVGI